ncbi:MAG: hypothetical protein HQK56_10075 [Deltaproteobacteria bacterium]|nr:hypothetical protein [Deltaproteobacteria bacterium]
MIKTEAERVAAWAKERMGDGGKRVTIILDAESVTIMESLKRPKESLHELFNRLLKDISKGSEAQEPTPAKEDNTKQLERILDSITGVLDWIRNAECYCTATRIERREPLSAKQINEGCYLAVTDKQYSNATKDSQPEPQEQHGTVTEIKPEFQGPGRDDDDDMYLLDVSGDDSVPSMEKDETQDQAKAVDCCLGGPEVDGQQPAVIDIHSDLATIKARKNSGEEFKRYRDDLAHVMLAWFTRGISQPKIAARLNSAGFVNSDGKSWNQPTVSRFLKSFKTKIAAKPDGPDERDNG